MREPADVPKPWEYGSEFAWPGRPEAERPGPRPWASSTLLRSGRDALRILADHGAQKLGWERIVLPAYYCGDVALALSGGPLAVGWYADDPTMPFDASCLDSRDPGDVFVVCNTFGLRGGPIEYPQDITIIEDHTHDPWSPWCTNSQASWAFASLRKSLPVPDGAALWSPAGLSPPELPAGGDELPPAASAKLLGMLLKAEYLDGDHVAKDQFLRLLQQGEALMAEGLPALASALSASRIARFDGPTWRALKRHNWQVAAERLEGAEGLRVLRPMSDEACPFSVVLELPSAAAREGLRRRLINANVYPAILWDQSSLSIEVLPRAGGDLHERLLSIPCDGRYTAAEVLRAVDCVRGVEETPASAPAVWLSPPDVGPLERRHLIEAFDSGWIAPAGPHLQAFEGSLSERTGRHAVAVASGTAALRLALRILGVGTGPDDEVWVPSMTFIGTVGPVVHLGARPRFFDSTATTWNLDPAQLASALDTAANEGRLPKAVIAVDLYGQCADYASLLAACDRYDIPLVSDAAEALGATWEEQPAGSFGSFAALSFNGNKIATTGGGGALLTPREDWAAKARYLATQAREPVPHYEHVEVGYNDRLSNLAAAVGLGQLETLDQRIARRRALYFRYAEALADLPFVTMQPIDGRGSPNYWLSCLTVDPTLGGPDPTAVCADLATRGIEARRLWKPMHLQPAFAGVQMHGGAVAEELYARGLCLPSGSSMDGPTQTRVVAEVRASLTRC